MKRLLLLALGLFTFGCGAPAKRVVIVPKPYKPKSYSNCKYTYTVKGKKYCVRKSHEGFVQVGIASWYGPGFHGSRTASGEIYNMYKLTAAHKTLPLGTYVKVINLENGKSVIVKVNDRGPFVKGRIIDLSYAAAKKLGMVKKGTARVKLIALGRKVDGHYRQVDYSRGRFFVQVGAFKNKLYAYRYRWRLYRKYRLNLKVVYLKGYYRVLAGPTTTLRGARSLKERLRKLGLKGSFIVSL
jgi:rare lipoprotein A